MRAEYASRTRKTQADHTQAPVCGRMRNIGMVQMLAGYQQKWVSFEAHRAHRSIGESPEEYKSMEQFPNVSKTYNIVILLYQKLFSLITDPDGQAVGEVSENRQYCVCRRALQYASNLS